MVFVPRGLGLALKCAVSRNDLLCCLARDAEGEGGGEVADGGTDALRLQASLLQNFPRHRAAGAVGELVKVRRRAQVAEAAGKNRRDFVLGKGQQRQAANDGGDSGVGKKILPFQL